MLSKQEKAKKKINLNLLISIIFAVSIGLLAVLNSYNILTYDSILVMTGLKSQKASNAQVSVHFIDVGQGSCTLIMSDIYSVLIDSGDLETSAKVVNYLNAQNITRLDYLIVTHPHSDHIGAMAELIDNFSVEEVIMPKIPEEYIPTNVVYMQFLKSIKDNNIKCLMPELPKILDLNMSSLQIFPPREKYENLNNYSIVSKLTHNENTFLFMGDAEKEVEQNLLKQNINLNSKVLLAGHHGSNTSSNKDFLEKVDPQLCVISCGADNGYNHPSADTISRLNKYTNYIFRTDLLGTILIESDGNILKYKYEKGESDAVN